MVIEQDQLSDSACSTCTGAHGDSQIGRLECEHIVDTVTGHGDGGAVEMQRVDHGLFLRGCHAPEDAARLHCPCQLGGIIGQRARIDRMICSGHSRLRSDRTHGGGVVTGDDLDRYALFEEVPHGLGCVRTQALADHDQYKRSYRTGASLC